MVAVADREEQWVTSDVEWSPTLGIDRFPDRDFQKALSHVRASAMEECPPGERRRTLERGVRSLKLKREAGRSFNRNRGRGRHLILSSVTLIG